MIAIREALGFTLAFEETEGDARYAVVTTPVADMKTLVRELDEDAAVVDPPLDEERGYQLVIGLAPPNEDWGVSRIEIHPSSGDNWAAWGIAGRIGSKLARMLHGTDVTGDPPPWVLAALDEVEPPLPCELPFIAMRSVPPLPGFIQVAPLARARGREVIAKLMAHAADDETEPRPLFLACLQRDPTLNLPHLVEHFEPIAMVVRVLRAFTQPSGEITLVLKGVARARIAELHDDEPIPRAEIEAAVEQGIPEAMPRSLVRIARYYSVLLEPSAGPSVMSRAMTAGPGVLADFIAHYGHKDDLRAPVLRALDVGHRVVLICEAHVNALAAPDLH